MNLSGFIDQFKEAIAKRVVESYSPLYRPSKNGPNLPRLLRTPMGGQEDAIKGAVLSLRAHRGTIVVGEMGTGKTFIGGAAAAHAAGFRRILVLCPPHLTRKWKREGGGDRSPGPRRHRHLHHRPGAAQAVRGSRPPLRGDVQGKGKAFLPLVPRRDPAVGRRRGPVGAGRADRGTLPGALLPLLSRSGGGQGRGSPDQRGAFPQAPRLRPVRLRALESEGRTRVVLSLLAIWSLKEEARGKAN